MEGLITWLWQGALLTLLVGIVLHGTTRLSASTRYLVWWAVLAAVLALPVLDGALAVAPSAVPMLVTLQDHAVAAARPVFPLELPVPPGWAVLLGLALWGATAAVRVLGVLGSVIGLRRAKRGCVALPWERQRRLPLWMAARVAGRRARVCVSDDVAVPCMLGLGTAVIALPSALVPRLSDRSLDRLVLHELGHVRRFDDWANLVQLIVESVCGWHPAVWWIGRALRLEREVACDDRVVDAAASPRAYAACLARVALLASSRVSSSLAPGAARLGQELAGRVGRLLNPMGNRVVKPSASVLGVSTAILIGFVVWVGTLSPVAVTGTSMPVVVIPDRLTPVQAGSAPSPRRAARRLEPGARVPRRGRRRASMSVGRPHPQPGHSRQARSSPALGCPSRGPGCSSWPHRASLVSVQRATFTMDSYSRLPLVGLCICCHVLRSLPSHRASTSPLMTLHGGPWHTQASLRGPARPTPDSPSGPVRPTWVALLPGYSPTLRFGSA